MSAQRDDPIERGIVGLHPEPRDIFEQRRER